MPRLSEWSLSHLYIFWYCIFCRLVNFFSISPLQEFLCQFHWTLDSHNLFHPLVDLPHPRSVASEDSPRPHSAASEDSPHPHSAAAVDALHSHFSAFKMWKIEPFSILSKNHMLIKSLFIFLFPLFFLIHSQKLKNFKWLSPCYFCVNCGK